MIKNNLIKIIMVISILLLIFSNCIVYAAGLSDPLQDPDAWRPTLEDETRLKEKVGVLLGTINVIGVVCSVVVLVLLGIKYMLGSVEEKAEYKKAMLPYVIGMFLLVACSSLPNIIYKFTEFLR